MNTSALFFHLGLIATMLGQQSPVVQPSTTSEGTLRRMATNKIRPIYPTDALKVNASGVAVADVYVPEHAGPSPRIVILEAPTPSIAASVKDALSQWRFQGAGAPGEFKAKVTFYFVIKARVGEVLDPANTPPFRGSWPRRPTVK